MVRIRLDNTSHQLLIQFYLGNNLIEFIHPHKQFLLLNYPVKNYRAEDLFQFHRKLYIRQLLILVLIGKI